MSCKIGKFAGINKLFRLVRVRDSCKELDKNLLTLSNKVANKIQHR